jgi:ribosome-binding factor A
MADPTRARRLAKRITAIVATELEHQVKDPRLAMVTITAATVTPDLRDAVVYYTVYGTQDEVDESARALASASGVLRSAVGRQTGIKFTPTLTFKPDTVPDNAHRIDELLERARMADAAVAEQAASARYAGEADPYRAPRERTDDDEDGDDGLGGRPDADDADAARPSAVQPN